MNPLEPIEPQPETGKVVEVNRADRWQVYYRLRELGISCGCAVDQPLLVEVYSTTAAIQLWSVVRQLTASRSELVSHLERCWQTSNDPKES